MLMTCNKKVKYRHVPCRKKNWEQKKSHLTNQNYVEIWSRFNPGFLLLALFLVTSCYERTQKSLWKKNDGVTSLSFLHIASVIGIFKKSTGQRYALLQRTVLGFF